MGLFVGEGAPRKVFLGDVSYSKIFVGDTQVRPTELGPLCFTAEEENSTVTLSYYGSPTAVNLNISTDGNEWNGYTIGETITLDNIGDKVYMRNESTVDTLFSIDEDNFYIFEMSGSISASGDIGYLLNINSTNIMSDYCFYGLFNNCVSLTSAPSLPATVLGIGCYEYMFCLCTGLTAAPNLPAITLNDYCYSGMFDSCENLVVPPIISAVNLAYYCCDGMFASCENLTTAPQLHATVLAEGCYNYMFAHCYNLITPPELPATTLADYCYDGMFFTCTSLETVPELPATTLGISCYGYMFEYCENLEELPELPATILTSHCYTGMFRKCTKIKLSTTQTGEYQTPYRIPITGTGTDALNALGYMFEDTGGTFTGSPTINTTYYTSNTII